MNSSTHVATLAFALILSGTQCASAAIGRCDTDNCRSDAKIASNVQTLLNGHPEFGPPASISVQSIDRVVYLRGLVDTGFEKWIAESVASQAPDVARVVNLIVENN